MDQREITDTANVRWSCVQAYSSGENPTISNKVSEKTEQSDQVTVVCTPSGGAQTVRLELPADWMEKLSDDELLGQLAAAQQERA